MKDGVGRGIERGAKRMLRSEGGRRGGGRRRAEGKICGQGAGSRGQGAREGAWSGGRPRRPRGCTEHRWTRIKDREEAWRAGEERERVRGV
eukprot:2199085-Rhodomonas_salina.1